MGNLCKQCCICIQLGPFQMQQFAYRACSLNGTCLLQFGLYHEKSPSSLSNQRKHSSSVLRVGRTSQYRSPQLPTEQIVPSHYDNSLSDV